MKDFTVIYLTASLIPKTFAEYQRKLLLEAIGDAPLISVSREPLDFGTNILDDGEKGLENIYRQMLRAAKVATTPYFIIAEDDALYNAEHFTFFRPALDTFAYNQHRFALFNWGVPTFNWRNRKSNSTLIAPRELAITALEERFAKHPNGMRLEHIGELGRKNVDNWLEVTPRKSIDVYSEIAVIHINHEQGSDDRARRHHKALGPIKAFDIPYWGLAKDVIKHYA